MAARYNKRVLGYPLKTTLIREICNEMNKLAFVIAEGGRL